MKNNPLSAAAGIHYLETVDSTMLEARRYAAHGAASGTVIRAGYQSAGRGRLKDRKWESKAGDSLMFTVIFSRDDLSSRMSGRPFTLLPILCGVAVAESLAPLLGGADIRIKWPNDVLADGRKICGILCEASGQHVYAGIGINLNQLGFPDELRRPACSMRMLGADVNEEHLLLRVLEHLNKELRNAAWQQALESRLYQLGKSVSIITGLPGVANEGIAGTIVSGRLAGINNSGALIIETEDGIKEVLSGELQI
jgi:BirA family biotin operon repressor/biotin-[acetyl-CoA-carboxylase] ligase